MFREASAEHLALLRIIVFGIWFGRIATTDVAGYSHVPSDLIEPVGVMRLFPVQAMLSTPWALTLLHALGLFACALAVLGVRPWRATSGVAVLMILWHDGAMKSIQGFVNHGQIALLLAAMFLVLGPARDAWSLGASDRQPRGEWRYGWPLLASATVLLTAYSLIGAHRLLWGGFGLFTDGSVLRWTLARSQQYAAYDFDVGATVVEFPYAWLFLPAGMLIVTAFEAASPLSLVSRRFRLTWVAVMVPFHVSTLFLMNIFFWENLALIAVLFLVPSQAVQSAAHLSEGHKRSPGSATPRL